MEEKDNSFKIGKNVLEKAQELILEIKIKKEILNSGDYDENESISRYIKNQISISKERITENEKYLHANVDDFTTENLEKISKIWFISKFFHSITSIREKIEFPDQPLVINGKYDVFDMISCFLHSYGSMSRKEIYLHFYTLTKNSRVSFLLFKEMNNYFEASREKANDFSRFCAKFVPELFIHFIYDEYRYIELFPNLSFLKTIALEELFKNWYQTKPPLVINNFSPSHTHPNDLIRSFDEFDTCIFDPCTFNEYSENEIAVALMEISIYVFSTIRFDYYMKDNCTSNSDSYPKRISSGFSNGISREIKFILEKFNGDNSAIESILKRIISIRKIILLSNNWLLLYEFSNIEKKTIKMLTEILSNSEISKDDIESLGTTIEMQNIDYFLGNSEPYSLPPYPLYNKNIVFDIGIEYSSEKIPKSILIRNPEEFERSLDLIDKIFSFQRPFISPTCSKRLYAWILWRCLNKLPNIKI